MEPIDRILDHKYKGKYFKDGEAFYLVRTASRTGIDCIYIYRNEFGFITKQLSHMAQMQEVTREKFTDQLSRILVDLNKMCEWIV